MTWSLERTIDYERHNADVAALWSAYHAGCPPRVPVSVTGSIRNYVQNPALNEEHYTFEDFFTDPEVQIHCQLRYQRWCRHHLLCDTEMGPPKDGWTLAVDFQNSYDAAWFGCPLVFRDDAVPDTEEILKEDKGRLFDLSCPDPLRDGLMGRAVEFYEYMHDRCRDLEFDGLPVLPPTTIPGECCDGPLQAAYKLRGAAGLCMDMMEDPAYFHELMEFVTNALVHRMKAVWHWRAQRQPECVEEDGVKRPDFGLADDAIVLLSLEQYEEFVFPYHRRMVNIFSDGGPISMHLCGDAGRFFPFLRDNLDVDSFDTGFPIDLGAVRRELGPDVEIRGGPDVMTLRDGPEEIVRERVRAACESGVMEGGRFIMIAANNLAPCTPVEHVAAMYDAAETYGRY